MTFDDAVAHLLALARRSGGVVTASKVEADPELAAAADLVAAAARSLDGSTNVFGTPRTTDEGWFPFDELRFSDLRS